jgi:Aspartyl protease
LAAPKWCRADDGEALLQRQPTPRPAAAQIVGEQPSTPWLHMELVQGRFIYLKGNVNGRETPILLDSGSSTSILSATFADALGLSRGGSIHTLQGATNAQEVALAADIDIKIGPLRLSGLAAAVADLAGPEKAMGRAMPVILGKEVFNAFVVDIDYPHSRIAFRTPESYRPERGARPLRLLPDEFGLKLVEASVEGLPSRHFIVDIAAAGNLTLFQAYADENGLLTDRFPRSQRLSRGTGGGSVVTQATLKSFTLAGFDLRDMPADFYQGRGGAFDRRSVAGNLGAGVLNRFRVVFDYSRELIYFAPGDGWDRPFCKNRAGVQADFLGSLLEVIFVAPDSPAAEAGWKVGERIMAIDHRPIAEDYLTSRVEWSCRKAGSTVILTDGAGLDRSLVLADYY